MDLYWFCRANPPIQCHPQKKLRAIVLWQLLLAWKSLLLQNVFFLYQKENVFVGYAHHFLGWIQIRKKILKYPMTWQLIFQAFIFFLRQKKQWLNSFKCCYLKWTDDPVEQNWLKCLGCSRSRLTNSAQQVPEPDQLPGISFDTRPNLIQFWKSSGSPKHRDSQTPMFPNTKIV